MSYLTFASQNELAVASPIHEVITSDEHDGPCKPVFLLKVFDVFIKWLSFGVVENDVHGVRVRRCRFLLVPARGL